MGPPNPSTPVPTTTIFRRRSLPRLSVLVLAGSLLLSPGPGRRSGSAVALILPRPEASGGQSFQCKRAAATAERALFPSVIGYRAGRRNDDPPAAPRIRTFGDNEPRMRRPPRRSGVSVGASTEGRSTGIEEESIARDEQSTESFPGVAGGSVEAEGAAAADDGDEDGENFADEKQDDIDTDAEDVGMICRIVASSDGKLPSSRSALPPSLFSADEGVEGGAGGLLERIDAIFHAKSHAETRTLGYLDSDSNKIGKRQEGGGGANDEAASHAAASSDSGDDDEDEEERRLFSLLRSALDDAGFERLSRRDLELCEALNAGYLLRLSIAPKLKDLDPSVRREFYPELYGSDEEDGETSGARTDRPGYPLFDGRVLIFRRGYSEEVTEGRLLLPKLDYLQAALVQKSAAVVAAPLLSLERKIGAATAKRLGAARSYVKSKLADLADSVKLKPVADFLKSQWGWRKDDILEERLLAAYGLGEDKEGNSGAKKKESGKSVFRLSRYGGIKKQFVDSSDIGDALNPFLVCEVGCGANGIVSSRIKSLSSANGLSGVEHDIYTEVNGGHVLCEYDHDDRGHEETPKQLLERVSVSNLVDFFSKEGRRGLIRRFFSKSELVEPTYEEVVVIWRPLPKKLKKPKVPTPPSFVYKGAEVFGIDDRLPERPQLPKPKKTSLEIRAFTDVPMANLLAVLPNTKLVFRPADAFVFDSVSLVSLLAVLGSQRYDSARLDLLAIVSVSLWVLRTFFRYSNKLARYDLTVNKFLTSKISHRGPGALRYISAEAGSQRAVRASLTHTWLVSRQHFIDPAGNSTGLITREEALRGGVIGVNGLIDCDRQSRVDVEAALDDLEELGLVRFSGDGSKVQELRTGTAAMDSLKEKWEALFNR